MQCICNSVNKKKKLNIIDSLHRSLYILEGLAKKEKGKGFLKEYLFSNFYAILELTRNFRSLKAFDPDTAVLWTTSFQRAHSQLLEWISSKCPQLSEWISSKCSLILEWISSKHSQLGEWISNKYSRLTEWISRKQSQLSELISSKRSHIGVDFK